MFKAIIDELTEFSVGSTEVQYTFELTDGHLEISARGALIPLIVVDQDYRSGLINIKVINYKPYEALELHTALAFIRGIMIGLDLGLEVGE